MENGAAEGADGAEAEAAAAAGAGAGAGAGVGVGVGEAARADVESAATGGVTRSANASTADAESSAAVATLADAERSETVAALAEPESSAAVAALADAERSVAVATLADAESSAAVPTLAGPEPEPTLAEPTTARPRIPRPRLPFGLGTSRASTAEPRPKLHPVTFVLMAAAAATYAGLAYRRRWIADDGMIAVRTVRQILAGHGPVYSPFERAEANTSALWTWLLAFAGWITGADVARVAVLGGLLCAVVAVVAAMLATARFHQRFQPAGDKRLLLIPGGVLILLGMSPYWDYATSGLETGLELLWLALCWLALVRWGANSPDTKRQYTVALLIGLGPLVRPEFTLVTVVFAASAWLLIRPGKRRTAALIATAVALPVLYEIFRAGYYGTLVPLPGLAKSATASQWSRGFRYINETVSGYLLWIPLAILVVAGAVHFFKKTRQNRVLLATPLVGGLLLGLYVAKVGGDFMHSRMVLPVVFLLLLPVFLVPATVKLVPAVAAVAVWAAVIGYEYPVHYRGYQHSHTEDERYGYQYFTGQTNPETSAAYAFAERGLSQALDGWSANGDRVLTSEGGLDVPLRPGLPFEFAVAAGRLGAAGVATPLDDTVVDTLGLANPLGARITVTNPGTTGHEKPLPFAWILADYGDPAVVDNQQVIDGVSPAQVRAARHAMSCGALKELLDSTRQPMTFGRFWDNLTGSPARTSLVIPADPFIAERKFCR